MGGVTSSVVQINYIGNDGLSHKEFCLSSQVAETLVYLEERGAHSIETFDAIESTPILASTPNDNTLTQSQATKPIDTVRYKSGDCVFVEGSSRPLIFHHSFMQANESYGVVIEEEPNSKTSKLLCFKESLLRSFPQ